MKKNPKILVIIAHRGIGDLIYHLPLLRSLHASFGQKLILISNKVNNCHYVFKDEKFVKKIHYFNYTRLKFIEEVKKIFNFKKYLNSFNSDYIYLTSNATRMMIPVMLSNAKNKIIFGRGAIPFTKENKYKYTTSSNKLFSYTKKLNLSKKIYNFKLTNNNNAKKHKKNILINVDSHHNQNDWKLDNYIFLINSLLKKKFYIYINFKSKNFSKEMFPNTFSKSKKIKFTNKKNIGELIKIIKECKYVVGNESGPICLGSSLKRKVHALYIPTYTEPESKLINSRNKYYNVFKMSEKKIISKILGSL